MLCCGRQQVEGTGNRARAGEYSTGETGGVGGVMRSKAGKLGHKCCWVELCRGVRTCATKNPPEIKSLKFDGSGHPDTEPS